jgi:ankyrin repeat protein
MIELLAQSSFVPSTDPNHISVRCEAKLDSEGRAPIHLAAEYGEQKTLETFCRYFKSTINLQTGNSLETALHIVCHRKRKDLVELLVSFGGEESPDILGVTPLHILTQTTPTFLSRNSSTATPSFTPSTRIPLSSFRVASQQPNKLGESLLELCEAGKLDQVEGDLFFCFLQLLNVRRSALLLANPQLNVNYRRPSDRKSALHLVCSAPKNSIPLALLLLHFGALVECLDCDGMSPLHEAAISCEAAIALFLSFGARATLADRNGQTPLFYAIEAQFVQGVNALLPHYGAAVLINRLDSRGDSYLHHACRKVFVCVVSFLCFLFSCSEQHWNCEFAVGCSWNRSQRCESKHARTSDFFGFWNQFDEFARFRQESFCHQV